MGLTKRDLDEVSGLSTRLFSVVTMLARLLRPIARLGVVKRFLTRSTGGRVGEISRHAERGDHEKAVQLAIAFLKENRHPADASWGASGQDYWWFFMDLAARSLEECGDRVRSHELIDLATDSCESPRGHYAARSFLAFSRWAYETGDYTAAVGFAETAARADETWANPDFVRGWYRLVLGGGDPLEHLTQAVRKDPGMLFKIVNDAACRQHPDIVRTLTDLVAEPTAEPSP